MRKTLVVCVVLLLACSGFSAPGWENEPAGSLLMSDWPFNAKTGSGWNDAYPGSPVSIISDATAPGSPSNVLQMIYYTGHKAGYGPGNIYYPIGQAREMYVGFWWKANAGWQQEMNSQVSKIAFFMANGEDMFTGMRGAAPPYRIYWSLEMPSVCNGQTGSGGDACNGTRNFDPNAGSVPIYPGTWYKIETYFKYSTTSTSQNGVLRFWVNGTLTGNYTNVNYPANNPMVEFSFAPTWGGMNNTKTQTDYFWFDHARLSKPNGAPNPLVISTSSMPAARSGAPYSATISASGGKAPYAWTMTSGSLLPGLSFNKSTGVVSGTPTTGGRCDFTVKVLDSNVPALETTKSFSIVASGTAAVEDRAMRNNQNASLRIVNRSGLTRVINPAAGDYHLNIFDMSGKLAYSYRGIGGFQNEITIPGLENGTYTAALVQNRHREVVRFHVMK